MWQSEIEVVTYREQWKSALLEFVNSYMADWPYCRQLDHNLLAHWQELPQFQPAELQLILKSGQPVAFIHGEINNTTYHVNFIALRPEAVATAVRWLQQTEQRLRSAGVNQLCGPNYRANAFYAGYVLGSEPYLPHWAVDTITVLVQSGFLISHPAVILTHDLQNQAPVGELPSGYTMVEAATPPEYQADAFRYVALYEGQEVATCAARSFAKLLSPVGGVVGQLGFVGTDETHRGKGLAKILVGQCLQRLRLEGAGAALIATGLNNLPALRAYEAVGFRRFCNINEWTKQL